MSVEITVFEEKYAGAFAALNKAWIEKYFEIEEEDTKALSNPHSYAVANGGEIFFALLGGEPVGTVAMIRKSEQEYELAKMAVDEGSQGQGCAALLMQRCIEFASAEGAQRITLTTNSILTPALNLYRKYGFVAQEVNRDTRYSRGNLQMVLELG